MSIDYSKYEKAAKGPYHLAKANDEGIEVEDAERFLVHSVNFDALKDFDKEFQNERKEEHFATALLITDIPKILERCRELESLLKKYESSHNLPTINNVCPCCHSPGWHDEKCKWSEALK